MQMQADYLDYRDTGYFSKTVLDYLDQHESLDPFYRSGSASVNFEEEIKNQQHKKTDRKLLVDVLSAQYHRIGESGGSVDDLVSANILSLAAEKTFTVTTGHQLNLFTGPLYTIYKILGTISLARRIKVMHPDYTIVPIFWMATEDHDFAEINHLSIRDKRIQWELETSGAVGRIPTHDIASTVGKVLSSIGVSEFLPDLEKIIRQAYLNNKTLADASRYLYNALFGRFGLVILDADDANLKKAFIPIIREDILEKRSYSLVSETNKKLEENGYHIQVHPREINFFYLDTRIRERIVAEGERYKVLNTDLEFNKAELEQRIEDQPGQFSPNVIMRPLYQEVLLPNLAYIGGGAEVTYWLSLHALFNAYKIPYPRLLLRNSALLVDEISRNRIVNLGFSTADFFKDPRVLTNMYVKRFSEKELDLAKQLEELGLTMQEMERKANLIEASLGKSTRAMHTRIVHLVKHLENKMLKTEKNKFDTQIAQIYKVHQKLFPKRSLQERDENFLPYYALIGPALFDKLLESFDPLGKELTILNL